MTSGQITATDSVSGQWVEKCIENGNDLTKNSDSIDLRSTRLPDSE